MRLTFFILLTTLGALLAADLPTLPEQQPFVIPHTNRITNVVITATTSISEVRGALIDGVFVPLKTNLLFRTTTNLWSTH